MTRRTSGPLAAMLSACLALVPHAAPAQNARPTPHAAIDRALAPLQTVVRDLHVTDAERARLADLFTRGETWAAEVVQAEHHGARGVVRSRTRRIDLLARIARGRVEAMRAEEAANEAERAAVAAEERRVQARAALERAVERRIELERAEAVPSFTLPAPDADASFAGADAGDTGGR